MSTSSSADRNAGVTALGPQPREHSGLGPDQDETAYTLPPEVHNQARGEARAPGREGYKIEAEVLISVLPITTFY